MEAVTQMPGRDSARLKPGRPQVPFQPRTGPGHSQALASTSKNDGQRYQPAPPVDGDRRRRIPFEIPRIERDLHIVVRRGIVRIGHQRQSRRDVEGVAGPGRGDHVDRRGEGANQGKTHVLADQEGRLSVGSRRRQPTRVQQIGVAAGERREEDRAPRCQSGGVVEGAAAATRPGFWSKTPAPGADSSAS